VRNPASGRHADSFQWNGCACVECAAMVDVVRQVVRSEGMTPVLVGHSSGLSP
jgi:hypothetical protein